MTEAATTEPIPNAGAPVETIAVDVTRGLFKCAHCKRKVGVLPDEVQVQEVSDRRLLMAVCPCGISTKLCYGIDELRSVWNSRGGKMVKNPTVELKHNSRTRPSKIPK